MKQGVSLLEASIALLIIIVALVVFLTLASNYLRTVRYATELYVMNSLAQEGLELVIAWRNKKIEVPFEETVVLPPVNGSYCISFSNNNINLQPSGSPCTVSFLGQRPNINYYRILNFSTNNDIISVTSSINSSIWRDPFIQLNIKLTPWHIIFQ